MSGPNDGGDRLCDRDGWNDVTVPAVPATRYCSYTNFSFCYTFYKCLLKLNFCMVVEYNMHCPYIFCYEFSHTFASTNYLLEHQST